MADCASCRLFSLCNYELWVNTAENIMVGVDFPLSLSGFQGLPVLMPLSSRVQMGFLNCDHAGWGGVMEKGEQEHSLLPLEKYCSEMKEPCLRKTQREEQRRRKGEVSHCCLPM